MTDDTLKIARLSDRSVASLQEFSEGSWVEYSEGNYGVITGVVSGPLDWPTGDEETEQVGEEGEDVYVVARASKGSKPFAADEIESAEASDAFDGEPPENPEEDIDEAEMAMVYYTINDSHDYEELQQGKDELLNVPGVDDPGVGFDSWPDSWRESDKPARLILLDAWSSMGGSWTGAFKELGSRRLASAMKDEVLGTERWRGRF